MKNKKFSDIIYGIDIETSTIDCGDDKCSFMYSFCISTMDLSTGEYNKKMLGRTYQELSNFLEDLNDRAEATDRYIIIYIHNLAYEFSFFSNNVDFIKENLRKADYKDCIYQSMNKPLTVNLERLSFRCSYLLLSKSIKTLGKELNLPKLDYDYDKLRTPLTNLDELEIEYNFRDVEIMLRAVYNLFYNNPYMSSAGDLPLTKTGVSRFNCEHNPDINYMREWIDKNGKTKKGKIMRLNNWLCNKEKAESESQLRLWESLFQGGLVYSNPKYCARVVKNVASYDFSSDYPYQMLYRYYPTTFKIIKKNRLKELRHIVDYLEDYNLISPKVSCNMFNSVIKISNVRAKYNFEPLATTKIINAKDFKNGYNCEIINGKVIRSDIPITMYATIIDYIMLKLFYDFDLIDCYYLEVAHNYSRTNPYKLECVRYNARAKIEFKRYNELVEHTNKYKEYSKYDIDNDYYRDSLNRCSDYFEQLQTSHALYQAVKSDLNALYGDNAQHLMRTNYLYDPDTYEWISKEDTFEDYKKSRVKTSYIYGMYVPQFARASILYIAYQFIKAGYDVLYIDTDSIKIQHDSRADEIVKDFNKIQLDNLGADKWCKFGILEREYIADKFSSLGTKSYIKLENNFLKATISGLPNATGLYNELYDYFNHNFDELVENVYHYGVCFDNRITNKLTSKYQFTRHHIKIDDYEDDVTSGVILEPCEVTMRDFTSKTWLKYAHVICNKFNRNFDELCCSVIIGRDKSGMIEVR